MRAYLAYLRQARRDAMALDLVDPCSIVSNDSFDLLRHPTVVSQILAWGVRGHARWIKGEKSCNLSGCSPLLSSPESHLATGTQLDYAHAWGCLLGSLCSTALTAEPLVSLEACSSLCLWCYLLLVALHSLHVTFQVDSGTPIALGV